MCQECFFIILRFLVDYGRNLHSHLLAFQTEDWSKIKKRYNLSHCSTIKLLVDANICSS